MAQQRELQHFSFGQIFMIGLLVFLTLQFATRVLWWFLLTYESQLTSVNLPGLSLPIIFVSAPIVLAIIIILFSRPKRQTHPNETMFSEQSIEPNTRGFSIDDIFRANYSSHQLIRILQWITIIWVIWILTQIMFWVAFQSYGHRP
jgi:hypothetical protein